MNVPLYDDEARMRDKMLGHEFPFDEKAWQDMQGLLEQATADGTSSGAFAKSASSWQSLTRLIFWTVAAFVLSGIRDFKGESHSNVQSKFLGGRTQSVQTLISHPSAGAIGSGKPLIVYSDQGVDKESVITAPHAKRAQMQAEANRARKLRRAQKESNAWIGFPNYEKIEKRSPEFVFQQKTNLQKSGGVLLTLAVNNPDLMPVDVPSRPKALPDVTVAQSSIKKELNLQEIGNQIFGEREQIVSSAGDPPPPAFVTKHTEGADFDPLSASEPRPVVQEAPETHALPETAPQKTAKINFNWGWHFGLGLMAVDYDKLRIGAPLHFGLFSKWTRNKDWSLRFHLTGKWAQGYRFEAKIYDYNTANSPFHMLSADQLVFIEMPLTLEKNRRRHSWFAGVKPAFNFALKPKVERFGAAAYHPELDVHDGLRDFDLGLALGWQYRLSPRIAIDFRYNQGLFDLSFDNFFKSKAYHLNSDFQVSILQYWR